MRVYYHNSSYHYRIILVLDKVAGQQKLGQFKAKNIARLVEYKNVSSPCIVMINGQIQFFWSFRVVMLYCVVQ